MKGWLSLILLLCFTLPFYARANTISEDQALDLLLAKIRATGLYQSRIELDCLGFTVESQTKTFFEFKVYENHHAKDCHGDKNTAPTVDRFRVFKQTKKIHWYAINRNQFVPFENALKSRNQD